MPISRATAGLIVYEEFDSYPNGWTRRCAQFQPFYTDNPYLGSGSLDTSIKHSGIGSFQSYLPANPGGGTIYFGTAFEKNLDLGSGSGRVARLWHKNAYTGPNNSEGYAFAVATGWSHWWDYSWYCYTPNDPSVHDWTLKSCAIPDGVTGVQACVAALFVTSNYGVTLDWADHLIICGGVNVTVTGLIPGQKVELYRSSDDTLIGTATCAAGATSVAISVTNEDFPEQMYLKVYGSDGVTLIETTTSYEMCGGDVWNWFSGTGPITISSDVFIIYRQAATGTPKTAHITAILKTNGGALYPGKTVSFSTTLGILSAASDVTDANGAAHTELTGTAHGPAVVIAQWLGDANSAAGSINCTVHIFYETEAGDDSKKYQFYCEGIKYVFVRGTYGINEQGVAEVFEVELPEWESTLTPNGLVTIYRLGTREYAGIFKLPDRTLSDNPQTVLKGTDNSILLDDQVVNLEQYVAETPQYIIADLLTKYPCGITAGSLGPCGATLTITIDTEGLGATIKRIADAVGWKIRVNLDRTLDFAEQFTGGLVAVQFNEGDNILAGQHTDDYYSPATWVRMKGNGISSTKQDGTAIQQIGLHKAAIFQKIVSDQATLDTMCQAYLDLHKEVLETVVLDVIDDYDPGAFAPEDQVAVTSPTLGLSGTYTIKRIERPDMMDPGYAKLEITNRTLLYWELDEEYQRMTKDANV